MFTAHDTDHDSKGTPSHGGSGNSTPIMKRQGSKLSYGSNDSGESTNSNNKVIYLSHVPPPINIKLGGGGGRSYNVFYTSEEIVAQFSFYMYHQWPFSLSGQILDASR